MSVVRAQISDLGFMFVFREQYDAIQGAKGGEGGGGLTQILSYLRNTEFYLMFLSREIDIKLCQRYTQT